MTFYEKMRIVCMAIPSGCVATYGQIAMLCGAPRNARQVGYGLKHNLAGADVPAHRVVNGKGILSGAGHFGIPAFQQTRLLEEGVALFRSGDVWCVDLKTYGWQTSLEEAEAFLLRFQNAQSTERSAEEHDHALP